VLRDFGFEHCYVCPPSPGADLTEMAVESGKRALERAGRSPDQIDKAFVYSGLGSLASAPARVDNPLELFRYPAARAHHLLGLGQAPVMALSQRGCSGLLSAVHMAAQLLQTAERPTILCLAGDALPAGG